MIAYGIYTLLPSNKKVERTLSYDDAMKIYSYINETFPGSPFHEEKIFIQDINENTLFAEILISLGYDKKTYETESCTDISIPCFIGNIEVDYLNTEIKKRYNTTLTNDTYFYNGIECTLDNDKYVCNLSEIDYMIDNVNLSMVYDFKTKDDKLEIYDLYLNYSSEGKCYLDNSKKYECNKGFKEDMNQKNSVELLNNYGMRYKHTFIKVNDQYYWYSSEMIKEAK